jgi:hypothetical protein
MSQNQTNHDGKVVPKLVVLTLDEAQRVAGGVVTVTNNQVWDALAQANADAKARSKPHYIAWLSSHHIKTRNAGCTNQIMKEIKAMSNYPTHEDRESLPQAVVLTTAETHQVAGGVSSEPVPPHALPSDPCVRTVATATMTVSRLTMNRLIPQFYGHGYFYTVTAGWHDLLSN